METQKHRQDSAPILERWHETVTGGKFVELFRKFAKELRDETRHPNQQLFLDDVVVACLLSFFNPTIDSLRSLEAFSQTADGQRFFSVHKISRSTFSEFMESARPELLEPLIRQLNDEVRRRGVAPPQDLPEALQQVLAVDGTFFTLTREVLWAVRHGFADKGRGRGRKRGGRVDVHLDSATGLPLIVNVHGCDTSETDNALAQIQPQAIHLYDRGIFSFKLIDAHQQKDAQFVARMRSGEKRCPKVATHETRTLTDGDEAAGVIHDRLVTFCGSTHTTPPEGLFREVLVRDPDAPTRPIRLVTNLLEIDAWVVAELYRKRWQVELFFRWLKIYAHFLKPMSFSKDGLQLQMYIAVAAILLIYLQLGIRPSKYAYQVFSWYLQGSMEFDEILPLLQEIERRANLERQRRARKRAEPPTTPKRPRFRYV